MPDLPPGALSVTTTLGPAGTTRNSLGEPGGGSCLDLIWSETCSPCLGKGKTMLGGGEGDGDTDSRRSLLQPPPIRDIDQAIDAAGFGLYTIYITVCVLMAQLADASEVSSPPYARARTLRCATGTTTAAAEATTTTNPTTTTTTHPPIHPPNPPTQHPTGRPAFVPVQLSPEGMARDEEHRRRHRGWFRLPGFFDWGAGRRAGC